MFGGIINGGFYCIDSNLIVIFFIDIGVYIYVLFFEGGGGWIFIGIVRFVFNIKYYGGNYIIF